MENQVTYTIDHKNTFCVETPVNTTEEYYDFHFTVKFNYFKQLFSSAIPTHRNTHMFEAYLNTIIRVLLSDPQPYTITNLYTLLELYVHQPDNPQVHQHPVSMVFKTYNDQHSVLLYTQLQNLLTN